MSTPNSISHRDAFSVVNARRAIHVVAKLFAKKNIPVRMIGSQAHVMYNKITREVERITIPNIPDASTPELISAVHGFLDHELGHVLFTDFEVGMDFERKAIAAGKSEQWVRRLHSVQNNYEDPFIERLMRNEYRGSGLNLSCVLNFFYNTKTLPTILKALENGDKAEAEAYMAIVVLRIMHGCQDSLDWVSDHPELHQLAADGASKYENTLPGFTQRMRNITCTADGYQLAWDMLEALDKKKEEEQRQEEEQQKKDSLDKSDDGKNSDEQEQSGESGDDQQEQSEADEQEAGDDESGDSPEESESSESGESGDDSEDSEAEDSDGDGGGDSSDSSDASDSGDDEADTDLDEDPSSDESTDGPENGSQDDAEEQDAENKGDDDGTGDSDSDSDSDDDDSETGESGETDTQDSGDSEQSDSDTGDGSDSSDSGDGDDDSGDGSDQQQTSSQSGDSLDEGAEDDGDVESEGEAADGDSEAENGDPDSHSEGEPEDDGFEDQKDEFDNQFEADGDCQEDVSSIEDSDGEIDLESEAGDEPSGQSDDEPLVQGDCLTPESLDVEMDGFNKLIGDAILDAHSQESYLVFTTELDEVKQYTPTPLSINKYGDISLRSLESRQSDSVSLMRDKLRRMVLAKTTRRYQTGQRRGRINSRALHRVSQGYDDVFKRRHEEKTGLNTAVSLVIDCSGSMNGSCIQLAGVAADAIAECMSALNVPFEISGFTTGHYAKARELVLEEYQLLGGSDQVPSYARWVPLYIPIFKPWSASYSTQLRTNLALATQCCGGKLKMGVNVDGESIELAAQRMMEANQRADRHIIFVLSDGQPNSGASAAGRDKQHLKRVVKKLNDNNIETVGIGIMSQAVTEYYEKHAVLKSEQDIPTEMLNQLERVLLG